MYQKELDCRKERNVITYDNNRKEDEKLAKGKIDRI